MCGRVRGRVYVCASVWLCGVAHASPVRRRQVKEEDQITICDLTGTGAQDTAIAFLALKKSATLGLGQAIVMK